MEIDQVRIECWLQGISATRKGHFQLSFLVYIW